MSRKNTNRNVEELFRESFSKYELKPSAKLWGRVQRSVRMKEFLRFNPGSFNVYYMGALIVGTSVAGILGINSNTEEAALSQQISESINIPAGTEALKPGPEQNRKLASKGSASAAEKVSSVDVRELIDKADKPSPQTLTEDAGTPLKTESSKGRVVVVEPEIIINKLATPAPTSVFSSDNLSGCVPLKVGFENLSANYDSLLWEFGHGGYSTENEPVWIFDEAGEYSVKLLAFGSEGRISKSEVSIKVYPGPRARFEVSRGDPVLPDEEVMFYNYSENAIDWEWDFGDGSTSRDFEPSHQYTRNGSYSVKLTAISAFGCRDSIIITDAFGENSCFLRFPNAFMPNDGGPTGGYYSTRTDIQSEVFHPVWSGVTEYNLRIFTRTGQIVFESDDIEIGWDGYYRGQKADPGVYIWKVRGVFKNGEPFVKGGDLTLIPRK